MPAITNDTILHLEDRVLNKKSGAVCKITKLPTRNDKRFTLENVETQRVSRPTLDTLIKQYRVGVAVDVEPAPEGVEGIDISSRAADFVVTEPQADREAFNDESYVPGEASASARAKNHVLLFIAGFLSGGASVAIVTSLT